MVVLLDELSTIKPEKQSTSKAMKSTRTDKKAVRGFQASYWLLEMASRSKPITKKPTGTNKESL